MSQDDFSDAARNIVFCRWKHCLFYSGFMQIIYVQIWTTVFMIRRARCYVILPFTVRRYRFIGASAKRGRAYGVWATFGGHQRPSTLSQLAHQSDINNPLNCYPSHKDSSANATQRPKLKERGTSSVQHNATTALFQKRNVLLNHLAMYNGFLCLGLRKLVRVYYANISITCPHNMPCSLWSH